MSVPVEPHPLTAPAPDSYASTPSVSDKASVVDQDPELGVIPAQTHANGLTDQTFYLPRRKIITIFLACASTEIVALLDEKGVAAALSIISSELGAGSKISWVAAAYFLTSTACTPLYGRISDIFSRKTILFVLMFIFFLGSLASSLAQNVVQLVVFRAITGIGGGGLILMGQLIVGDVVSVRERGKYQGILGAFVALSNGIGPLIGAAFAQKASWRWIFRMNMPLAVVASLCVYFFMPLKKVEGTVLDKLKKVDFVGSFLVLVGTGSIILALTWGGADYPWSSTAVLVPLITGCVIACAFVIWEWRFAPLPLIPVYIFKYTMVIGAALTHFVNGYGMYVQIFYLPTFYQLAYAYGAVRSASLLLPVVLFQTLFSTLSGAMVSWKGRYRELLLSGWATWSISLGLFATLDDTSSLAKQVGYSVLAGVGIGQTLQPSLVAVQAAVERKDMAVTTTARSFLHNLGGVIGLTVSGSIINNVLARHLIRTLGTSLSDSARKAILDNPIAARQTLDAETLAVVIEGYRLGFRILFIVCASLTACSFFVTLFLMPHISLKRDDDKALKARAKEELERRKELKRRDMHVAYLANHPLTLSQTDGTRTATMSQPPTLSPEDAVRAEIASADLSMAVDGSFVETSSSHAARELKKRLDQLLGVGKNGVRSPYALTITQSPSGTRVFRVGFRPTAPDPHVLSPTTSEMPRHDGPGGLLSPLTAINSSSTAGLHQRAATRTHSPTSLLPVPISGYSFTARTRSGSVSTRRPSTSTWVVEAEKVPLPDDLPSDLSATAGSTLTEPGKRPRAYTGPQYYRLDNTDMQIYSRTGDSDIFSSAMGWSDVPRDVTRDPRPISERPFLQLDPGAFPFGRGVLYTRPPSGIGSLEVRRSSLDRSTDDTTLYDPTADEPSYERSSTDTAKDTLGTLIKYPTDIFQVLQTYRGLPTLDVLLESHDTPTAKLSTTTSAVPQNDPRFVIYGDAKPTSDTITASRRKITKPKPLVIPPDGIGSSEQRVIMAATIERWVAQLTSELNYDALLDFFLTYRAYVTANDLCHLLICRFHWALEPTASAQDETVRRIVRVRTFIAFRYWLSTFFQVDFFPNRVLRNEFTAWLNALRKDPMLTAKPDAVIIIQKLRKIVREYREAHVARPDPKSPQSPIERLAAEPTPLNLHALRTAFEPAPLPSASSPANGSDVDLIATTPVIDSLTAVTIHPKSTPASPPRKSSLVLPFPRSDVHPPRNSLMPMHHGPLTRAFVNTMGRIGRWKRGLGARSTMSMVTTVGSAGCVDASAYDGDFGLLGMGMGGMSGVEVVAVRGGVEEYLKMCGLAGRSGVIEDQEGEENGSDEDQEGEAGEEANDLTVVPLKAVEEIKEEEGKGRDTPTSTSTPRLLSQFPIEAEQGEGDEGSLRHSRRASDATQMQLYATTLRDSWLPEAETVSIDDADLSDSSSECEIVRRPPRRLPNRRDFEFATARTDSASSLAARSSVPSVHSVQSASDPTTPDHIGAAGPIESWQIDFLGEDSEDEKEGAGDAEAALHRLEGQIDAEEQRLRDLKVDKWLKRVQELNLQRGTAGGGREGGILDLATLGLNFDEDENEEEEKDVETEEGHGETEESLVSDERDSVAVSSQVAEQSTAPSMQLSTRPSIEIPTELHSSSAQALGSNISPTHDASSPRQHEATSPRQRIPKQIKKPRPAKDTSFLLQHRSEVIAHNLSAIERGLFMAISFEELVMHNWGPQSHDLNVTDWMQYRTDAAQHRIQPNVQKEGGKDLLTSDVLAVRARFNLTANFVASEIVMAHPTQRALLVNKLIRIAWKLYRMNNFATLCAIMTGLSSVWVDTAMKRLWPNVGMWEVRVFKDLKWFISSTDNFRFMREGIMTATSDPPGTASDKGSDMLVGCVPFLGIYLSELSEYAKLPDFIDPTRPEEPVCLDPITGEFAPLHDPEAFSTLPDTPSCMPLRPLLNLQKQRQIAGVVRELINGQHMASACRFNTEQKVYSRCLRLKCADGATLWKALANE